MKKSFYLLLLVACVTSLSSCRGSGGKKVATEAIEFLEKEAGCFERNAGRLERGVLGVEENANQTTKSAEEEYNNYQNIVRPKSGKTV